MKKLKCSWVARMEVTRTVEIITDDCTEQEARTDPHDHAIDEMEIDQIDWKVKSVMPNI